MHFHPTKSAKKFRDWWEAWLEKRREKSTRRIVGKIKKIIRIAREESLYPSLSKVERDEVNFAVQVIGIKRGDLQIKRIIVWVIVAISALLLKILAN